MAAQWYYQVMGEEMGPVSAADLAKQAQVGVITPDTFVRRADDENWHVAQSVSGLFDHRSKAASTGAGSKPEATAQPPRPPQPRQTRETAEKLCERIRDAMSGILGEVEDEEMDAAQIAQICETLRPIVAKLEELEGSL